jgi:hypothetical protein
VSCTSGAIERLVQIELPRICTSGAIELVVQVERDHLG